MWSPLKDILSEKKVVESALLNYAGAQVVRYLLTSAAFTARGLASRFPESEEAATLRRDGFVKIPGFLEKDHFELVKEEFARAPATARHQPALDGDNLWDRYSLSRQDWLKLPAVARYLNDPRLIAILRAAERQRVSIGDVWFEMIRHGDPLRGEDPQKQLHTDVFFNSHKVWLFLEPVSLEDGPLCFVKRTHRASLKRALFEYKKSIRFGQMSDYSFRLDEKDRERFGIEEELVVVPENTLVIANTRGIHRRGDAVPGHTRKQIYFSIRGNPFSLSADREVAGRR